MFSRISFLVLLGCFLPLVLSRPPPSVSLENDGHGSYNFKYDVSHPKGSSRGHMRFGAKQQQHGGDYPSHSQLSPAPHHADSYRAEKEARHPPPPVYSDSSDEVLHDPRPIYPSPYDSSEKQKSYDGPSYHGAPSAPEADYHYNGEPEPSASYGGVKTAQPISQVSVPAYEEVKPVPVGPNYQFIPDGPPYVVNSHSAEIVHPPLPNDQYVQKPVELAAPVPSNPVLVQQPVELAPPHPVVPQQPIELAPPHPVVPQQPVEVDIHHPVVPQQPIELAPPHPVLSKKSVAVAPVHPVLSKKSVAVAPVHPVVAQQPIELAPAHPVVPQQPVEIAPPHPVVPQQPVEIALPHPVVPQQPIELAHPHPVVPQQPIEIAPLPKSSVYIQEPMELYRIPKQQPLQEPVELSPPVIQQSVDLPHEEPEPYLLPEVSAAAAVKSPPSLSLAFQLPVQKPSVISSPKVEDVQLSHHDDLPVEPVLVNEPAISHHHHPDLSDDVHSPVSHSLRLPVLSPSPEISSGPSAAAIEAVPELGHIGGGISPLSHSTRLLLPGPSAPLSHDPINSLDSSVGPPPSHAFRLTLPAAPSSAFTEVESPEAPQLPQLSHAFRLNLPSHGSLSHNPSVEYFPEDSDPSLLALESKL